MEYSDKYTMLGGNYSSIQSRDLVVVDIPTEYADTAFIFSTLLPLFESIKDSVAVLVITNTSGTLQELLVEIQLKCLPYTPNITYLDTVDKFFSKTTKKKFKTSINGKVSLVTNAEIKYISAFPEFKDIVAIKTLNPQELAAKLVKRVTHISSTSDLELGIKRFSQFDFAHLLQEETLFIDIETYSLFFMDAGIHSISFTTMKDVTKVLLVRNSPLLLDQLKQFFVSYKGKKVFHGGGYDIKVLIYTLFMNTITDRSGLLEGWKTLTSNYEDSMLIAYTCLNSVKRQEYSLKVLASAHLGDYALEDIENIQDLSDADVVTYNGLDTIATKLVYTDYLQRAVAGGYTDFYYNYLLPTQKTLIYTEMCGMPVRPSKIEALTSQIESLVAKEQKFLESTPEFQAAMLIQQQRTLDKANQKLKVKVKTLDDIPLDKLLLTSSDQMAILFFEVMQLPVLSKTAKTGKPSVSEESLQPLLDHNLPEHKKKIISSYLDWIRANKILSTYVPALNKAVLIGDDVALLFGNFSCSKQISGRLSSSKPNLQNLPAKSAYGKLVKACFVAPEGWLFGGADFNSLEDRISALLTKDPNKLRVYTGHDLYEVTTPTGTILVRDDSTINGKPVQEIFNEYAQSSSSL